MVWTEGIQGEMKKNCLTYDDVSRLLGLSINAVSNKILNKTEFKASEIQKLAKALNLQGKYDEYFFIEELE